MKTSHPSIDLILPGEYDAVMHQLRTFFRGRGYLETAVQHRLSILAACEDPLTIGTFNYAGNVWPLPQTGQMWLEWELLNNPQAPGYYCISTSYRNEPDPIPGRHNLVFPIFEFEQPGDISALERTERDLLIHLGFTDASGGISYPRGTYSNVTRRYCTDELSAEHEQLIARDYGSVFFLTRFPETTSPFWNMRRESGVACKIDVILHGVETIGSAERSTEPETMRHLFHSISNGMYASTLSAQFGSGRVNAELDDFLALPFFPRSGGGIGITRLIRAMKLSSLL